MAVISLNGSVATPTQTNIQTGLFAQGVDHTFPFTIYSTTAQAAITNVAAYAMTFMVKKHRSDADAAALITKTTASGIAISGSFNASPSSNTQVTTVTVEDTDTTTLNDGLMWWELTRTDAGSETTLGYGTIVLEQWVRR